MSGEECHLVSTAIILSARGESLEFPHIAEVEDMPSIRTWGEDAAYNGEHANTRLLFSRVLSIQLGSTSERHSQKQWQ